jgi:hypothetical protein
MNFQLGTNVKIREYPLKTGENKWGEMQENKIRGKR